MNDEKGKMELSEAAREARKAYNREYYARNKEAAKRRKIAYWERRAQAAKISPEE